MPQLDAMQPSGAVRLEHRDAVAVLRFDHPPRHLIDGRSAAALLDHVQAALQDPHVHALVLTGAEPGHFIRHMDVRQLDRAADALATGQVQPEALCNAPYVALCNALDQATKPVIAAIDGMCIGGGFEIALCCTARIAGPRMSHIGLPEIRLGLFPGAGGTRRLAHLIGRHRARLFILDGRTVDPAQALALGLIDELADDPLAHALALAAQWARRSPGAVSCVMSLLRHNVQEAHEEVVAFGQLLRDHPEARAQLHAVASGTTAVEHLP